MRLFISHKSEDKRRAHELFRVLNELPGVEVWLDIFNLAVGDSLDEILPSIEESDAVILLWSKAASESEWVRREAEHGLAVGRPVIPILLDRTIPEGLGAADQLLYVDFWDDVLGLGHLCLSYVAATALDRAGHTEELELLRRYEGLAAHGIRNLLIRRTGVDEAFYWSSHARDALEDLDEAVGDLLDELDEDDELFGVLDGVGDIVWAMHDRLEELLSYVEMEEAVRAVYPDFTAEELEGCAMGVWEYLSASEDVFERFQKHSRRFPDLVDRLDEYQSTDEDIVPTSDHSFMGLHDDAWLILNAAFRVEELGLIKEGKFKVDWEGMLWKDSVVRMMIPVDRMIALEGYLRQIIGEEMGVEDALGGEIENYEPTIQVEGDMPFYFMPAPYDRGNGPGWSKWIDD